MARDRLEAVGLTDPGRVRQFNEDRIAVSRRTGVLAVADGMGGHRAGEVAAELAVDLVVRTLESSGTRAGDVDAARRTMVESINQANRSIHEAGQRDVTREGMGTTLAVAWIVGERAVLAHVGDSRIYRSRAGAFELLTRDDSLLRDAIDAGLIDARQAPESHNRSLVTSAVGATARVDAHVQDVDAQPGDVFLLCTDGLSDLVDDDDIALIVGSLQSNLPLAAAHLVQTAKDHGGFDNVSVVLARIPDRIEQDASGLIGRLRAFWRSLAG